MRREKTDNPEVVTINYGMGRHAMTITPVNVALKSLHHPVANSGELSVNYLSCSTKTGNHANKWNSLVLLFSMELTSGESKKIFQTLFIVSFRWAAYIAYMKETRKFKQNFGRKT